VQFKVDRETSIARRACSIGPGPGEAIRAGEAIAGRCAAATARWIAPGILYRTPDCSPAAERMLPAVAAGIAAVSAVVSLFISMAGGRR
jgi:hypothetical protein